MSSSKKNADPINKFKFFSERFGGGNKGSYFCTPKLNPKHIEGRNGWSKNGQKIFESLEVTALNLYDSTR